MKEAKGFASAFFKPLYDRVLQSYLSYLDDRLKNEHNTAYTLAKRDQNADTIALRRAVQRRARWLRLRSAALIRIKYDNGSVRFFVPFCEYRRPVSAGGLSDCFLQAVLAGNFVCSYTSFLGQPDLGCRARNKTGARYKNRPCLPARSFRQ